ncbi:MAG: hypothetical protein R6V10_08970 [bacterium]
MERLKTTVTIGIVICVLGAVLQACPRDSSPKDVVTSSQESGSKEELQKKYDRLEVLYDILRKDDPSQQETRQFRDWMAEAKESLKNDNPAKAADRLEKAKEWMSEARPRYYRSHKERIASGESGKSCKALMSEALDYKSTAAEAEQKGESWTAQQYYRAAMEQGELALLCARQSPDKAMVLIDLYPSMRSIYRSAGALEREKETRGEVTAWLHSTLRDMEQEITDRLSGKAEGYDQSALSRNQKTFDKKARQVRKLNQSYLELASAAQSRFPESRFQPMDFSGHISSWERDWHNFFQGSPGRPQEREKEDKGEQLKKELERHNRIKQGAKSIEGSGIILEELGVFSYGPGLFLKGKIQNKRSEPIYNPRVVVTGRLMSEVVEIGYHKMSPLFSATFRLPLQHFSSEAYTRNKNTLPSHELLLIFKERPQGPDIKLIKKIK